MHSKSCTPFSNLSKCPELPTMAHVPNTLLSAGSVSGNACNARPVGMSVVLSSLSELSYKSFPSDRYQSDRQRKYIFKSSTDNNGCMVEQVSRRNTLSRVRSD